MPGRGAATARRPLPRCRGWSSPTSARSRRSIRRARTELGGVTLLRHELPASGISYVSLYFDITGLGGEETAAVSFLSELLGKVDTAEHPAQELSRLTQLHCGNMSFSVDVYDNSAESYRAKLTARVSALESSIGKALGPVGRGAHGQPPRL